MLKKTAVILSTFAFAFLILIVSVFKTCGISASSSPSPTPVKISYAFAYTGGILPDSPFWYAKALRDRVWITLTTNKMRKAELSLLFADKRLMAAEALFVKNKPQIALSTLTKAEKYLMAAGEIEVAERKGGADTKSFLMTYANASIAHMAKIKEITGLAPEGVKPEVIAAESYAKNAYRQSRDALGAQGIAVPKNPYVLD